MDEDRSTSTVVGHTLVFGGARSGKSRLAEAEAASSGLAKVYIATATAFDDEMHARIARHRADRDGAGWRTVEEPLALSQVLGRESASDRVVLVDCLTLWLANLMLGGHDHVDAAREMLDRIADLPGPAILVSNEVGWGVVPDHPLGREFRDAQGRLNQQVAQVCDRVILVAAGLPLELKPGRR